MSQSHDLVWRGDTCRLDAVKPDGWFRFGPVCRETTGRVVYGVQTLEGRVRVLVTLLDSTIIGGLREARLEPDLVVEIPREPVTVAEAEA